MATLIQYTIQDMKNEIATLFMEAKGRARREDELTLKLQAAEQKIAELEGKPKQPAPELNRATRRRKAKAVS